MNSSISGLQRSCTVCTCTVAWLVEHAQWHVLDYTICCWQAWYSTAISPPLLLLLLFKSLSGCFVWKLLFLVTKMWKRSHIASYKQGKKWFQLSLSLVLLSSRFTSTTYLLQLMKDLGSQSGYTLGFRNLKNSLVVIVTHNRWQKMSNITADITQAT